MRKSLLHSDTSKQSPDLKSPGFYFSEQNYHTMTVGRLKLHQEHTLKVFLQMTLTRKQGEKLNRKLVIQDT